MATLAEDTWYHFAIEVNSTANTYTLYLNGTAIRSNGTLQGSNGTLSNIGYLGDVSTGAFSGQGWWDNFRVTQGAARIHYDYLDGTLGNWTVYNPVEQSSIIPHDNRGLAAYPYWTGFGREIEQRLRVVALAYLLTSDSGLQRLLPRRAALRVRLRMEHLDGAGLLKQHCAGGEPLVHGLGHRL